MAAVDALPQYCPSCGGPNPAATAGSPCSFCTTPLVPVGTPDPRTSVRCSRCATLVKAGAGFCSSCGQSMALSTATDSPFHCPGCGHHRMRMFCLSSSDAHPQGHPVHGCPSCAGAWVDRETLQTVLEGAARQAPMEGHGTGAAGVRRRRLSRGQFTTKIVYRPCPACEHRMHRKNFARISGIIIDECTPHGAYFDAGELEDVLGFVRSGGLAMAQRKEADERARLRKSELNTAAMNADMMQQDALGTSVLGPHSDTLVLASFVGWASGWLSDGFG